MYPVENSSSHLHHDVGLVSLESYNLAFFNGFNNLCTKSKDLSFRSLMRCFVQNSYVLFETSVRSSPCKHNVACDDLQHKITAVTFDSIAKLMFAPALHALAESSVFFIALCHSNAYCTLKLNRT